MSFLRTNPFAQRGIAWTVLFAGLLSTIFVWHRLREERIESATSRFEIQAGEVVAAIGQRLRQNEQILLGGAAFFNATEHVSRQQWHTYVEGLHLTETYPGIQGVGFVQIIAPADLEDHIKTVRSEGFPNYTIKPPGIRPAYSSVVYLEPFSDRNLAAFGFDMFSEEKRFRGLQYAVNGNCTSITGKVRLIQEIYGKPQAGFLMYVPIYHKNLPLNTPEERWRALKGAVHSPYRVDDLMRGILGANKILVDFTIHDGEVVNPDSLMYDSAEDHNQRPVSASLYSSLRRIHAYGNTWTIALRSRPAYEARFAFRLESIIAALGAGISVSLFVLTLALLSRREQALALAAEMTVRRTESEERFRQLYLNIGQGVVIYQDDGRVLDANPAAERILGVTQEQLRSGVRGEPTWPIDPQWQTIREDGSDFADEDFPPRVALREGRAVVGVVMGVWHPIERWRRWIRMDAYPQGYGTGEADRVYAVFGDITEQRNADLDVRATRKLLSDVLTAASEVAIIATDATGLITIFNRGAERLLGYRADEVVRRETMASFHVLEEVQARAAALYAELGEIEFGRVFTEKLIHETAPLRDWTYVHKDGHHIPVSLVVSVMYDDSGAVIGYVGIAEDATERKRVERMKSEFVSTVSHELRTPLTSISGALGLIAGGAVGEIPAGAREMIDIARRNGQRLTHLINDLLDIEKIAAGKLHFDMQLQPLLPLVYQSLEAHKAYGAERHVRLTMNGPGADVNVCVDAQRLMQILANLLSNAIKFSPVGGNVTVSVSTRGRTLVRVAVSDSGPGIPADFRSHLFERFAQADSSDRRSKGGTGLGLAISRDLVERMGGEIGFESSEGAGACFFFELPVRGISIHPDDSSLAEGLS